MFIVKYKKKLYQIEKVTIKMRLYKTVINITFYTITILVLSFWTIKTVIDSSYVVYKYKK